MLTKTLIKKDPSFIAFENDSEVILDADIVKVEPLKYEDHRIPEDIDVPTSEVESKFVNLHSAQFIEYYDEDTDQALKARVALSRYPKDLLTGLELPEGRTVFVNDGHIKLLSSQLSEISNQEHCKEDTYQVLKAHVALSKYPKVLLTRLELPEVCTELVNDVKSKLHPSDYCEEDTDQALKARVASSRYPKVLLTRLQLPEERAEFVNDVKLLPAVSVTSGNTRPLELSKDDFGEVDKCNIASSKYPLLVLTKLEITNVKYKDASNTNSDLLTSARELISVANSVKKHLCDNNLNSNKIKTYNNICNKDLKEILYKNLSKTRKNTLPHNKGKKELNSKHALNNIRDTGKSSRNERFDKSSTKNNHQLTCAQEKIACDICGKSLSSKTYLLEHMNIHSGHTPYQCPVCARSFSVRHTLTHHLLSHAPDKPCCDVCGKTFLSKYYLSIHLRSHTGNQRFKCTVCGKGFHKLSHMERHNLVHFGEKAFPCDVCGKAFKLKESLTTHKIVHRKNKPFVCEICNARFKGRGSLYSHLKIHNKKAYTCDVCDKEFSHKSNLNRHKVIHSKIKPHKCRECGLRFKLAYCLRRHQLVHSEERPFCCNICERAFKCKQKLRRHLMTVHGSPI